MKKYLNAVLVAAMCCPSVIALTLDGNYTVTGDVPAGLSFEPVLDISNLGPDDYHVTGSIPGTLSFNPVEPPSTGGLEITPGTWIEVPNSRLYDARAIPTPIYDFQRIILSWSGAVFDSKESRLIVFGGGHFGHSGNAPYAFSLRTLQWEQLSVPSIDVLGDVDNDGDYDMDDDLTGVYPDGRPRARETYQYIEYLPNTHEFCSFGGVGLFYQATSTRRVDCFDLVTRDWYLKAEVPDYNWGGWSLYDPKTGYVWTGKPQLFIYDTATDAWIGATTYMPWMRWWWGGSAVLVSNRGMIFAFGRNEFYTWDISDPENPVGPVAMVTTGDTEIESAYAPGTAYDPITDQIVAWNGGENVYLLDLDTFEWTRREPAPGNTVIPSQPAIRGTHGRFRYVPEFDVFVVYNNVYENVFIYRMEQGR